MTDLDKAVRAFREATEPSDRNETTRLTALARALDCLALARSSLLLPAVPEADVTPQLPTHRELYDHASSVFPSLGPYNVAGNVVDITSVSAPIVGDPHDDIADIDRELHEYEWRRDNVGLNDAVWHFIFSFDSHWGLHLRQLQMYLFHFNRGA